MNKSQSKEKRGKGQWENKVESRIERDESKNKLYIMWREERINSVVCVGKLE